MRSIDFWFSIGSTYSYLTVMRLAEVETATGIGFRWRPFNVRRVMIEQNSSPSKTCPRRPRTCGDIERRGQRYGLSPRLPAPYPLPGLVLANQVATLGVEEGWVAAYTHATFRRWVEGGEAAGEEPNLLASLSEIGCDPSEVLGRAQSKQVADALEACTDEAMRLGVFGSPTFVVGEEVFWGDDCLDDAILWAKEK